MSRTHEVLEEMDSVNDNNFFSGKENLSSDPFNSFEFQNQLTSVVEELKLKRRLEEENENTIKTLLEEKYCMERKMDEQQRIHQSEKTALEELITQLKKTIEDGLCISDDEKLKQQSISHSFQQEIRALKDEARVLHADKLNQEKKAQELEGKLKLFNSFQEATIRQVNDIRQHTKSLAQHCQDLFKMQDELKKNGITQVEIGFTSEIVMHINCPISLRRIHYACSVVAKYRVSTEHMSQIMSIMKKKNCSLKHQVVSLRTQIQLQNEHDTSKVIELENSEPLKGLHNVLAVEEMLKQSQKQNKEILRNLMESSELVNQYVVRVEESEKARDDAVAKLDECEKKMLSLQRDLEIRTKSQKQIEKEYANSIRKWKVKERMVENRHDVGAQTEVSEEVEWGNISSAAYKGEKSATVCHTGFEERCCENASVQTDCSDGLSSNIVETQDVCVETAGQFAGTSFSVAVAVDEESAISINRECINTTETEETFICDENQMSQLSDPVHTMTVVSFDYLTRPVINKQSLPNQGNNSSVFPESEMTNRYSTGTEKGILCKEKETFVESEVHELSDVDEHCENSVKSVDNSQNMLNTSNYLSALDTPKAVKRHCDETDIEIAPHSKKRPCDKAEFLQHGENVGYACSTEKCSENAQNMRNVNCAVTAETRVAERHCVDTNRDTIHCDRKYTSDETGVFPPSNNKSGGNSSSKTPVLKPFSIIGIISETDKGNPCEKKCAFRESDVTQLIDSKKHSESDISHVDSLESVLNASCCSAVLGETDPVQKSIGDADAVRETVPCDEKHSCNDSEVSRNKKHSDYMTNVLNASAIVTEGPQAMKENIAEIARDKFHGRKGEFNETGILLNSNERRTNPVPKKPIVKYPSLICMPFKTDKWTPIEKRDICSERILSVSDTEKCNEICKEPTDGPKSPQEVILNQNGVERPLKATDSEIHACGERCISHESKVSLCDTILGSSTEKQDCVEDLLNVNVSSSVTTVPEAAQRHFAETDQENVCIQKQMSGKTNVLSHGERGKETATKFSAMTGTFSEPDKGTLQEEENIFCGSQVMQSHDIEEHGKNCGTFVASMESVLNTSSCPFVLSEPKEMKNNLNGIHKISVYSKNLDFDENNILQFRNSAGHAYCPEKHTDFIRSMSSANSPATANPQVPKEHSVGTSGKTIHCDQKQTANRTEALLLNSKAKGSGYHLKLPVLKYPGMFSETDKGVLHICNKGEAAQFNATEKCDKTSETHASLDSAISASKNLAVTGERKAVKRLLGTMDAGTTMHNKKRIFGESEVLKFPDTVGEVCIREKPIDFVGSEINVSVSSISPPALESSKVHFLETKQETVDHDRQHSYDETEAVPFGNSEWSCSSPSETAVKCCGSTSIVSETPCEKKDIFNKSEISQISGNIVKQSNGKSLDSLVNELNTSSCSAVVDVPKEQKESICGTIGDTEGNLTSQESNLLVNNNSVGQEYLTEKHMDGVRNKLNLTVTEESQVVKNESIETSSQVVHNSQKQRPGETEVYPLSGNKRSAICPPMVPVLKNPTVMTIGDKGKAIFPVQKETSGARKVVHISGIEKCNESSEKPLYGVESGLNMCKYLAVSDQQTMIKTDVGVANEEIPLNVKHQSSDEGKILQDDAIVRHTSFTEEHIDCVGKGINSNISSTATVETKVMKTHFVETNVETVLYGKNRTAEGSQIFMNNGWSSYLPFKSSLLKFPTIADFISRTGSGTPCGRKDIFSANEVSQLTVFKQHSESCGTPVDSEKNAPYTSSCSAVVDVTVRSKSSRTDAETPEGQEVSFCKNVLLNCDAAGSSYSPAKHTDCVIDMLNISSSTTAESRVAKKHVVEVNREIIHYGKKATSDKTEVLLSCNERATDYLSKMPFLSYPVASAVSKVDECIPRAKADVSSESSVSHFIDTKRHIESCGKPPDSPDYLFHPSDRPLASGDPGEIQNAH